MEKKLTQTFAESFVSFLSDKNTHHARLTYTRIFFTQRNNVTFLSAKRGRSVKSIIQRFQLTPHPRKPHLPYIFLILKDNNKSSQRLKTRLLAKIKPLTAKVHVYILVGGEREAYGRYTPPPTPLGVKRAKMWEWREFLRVHLHLEQIQHSSRMRYDSYPLHTSSRTCRRLVRSCWKRWWSLAFAE